MRCMMSICVGCLLKLKNVEIFFFFVLIGLYVMCMAHVMWTVSMKSGKE